MVYKWQHLLTAQHQMLLDRLMVPKCMKMVLCLSPASQTWDYHISSFHQWYSLNYCFKNWLHLTSFFQGLPCNINGEFLPEGAPPPPWDHPPPTDFSPFENCTAFELADLLFHQEQMSAGNINNLLQIWASTLPCDQDPPFDGKQDMYDTIDRITEGDAPWQNFNVSFNGEIPEGDTTPWKHTKYDVWFHDPHVMLHN